MWAVVDRAGEVLPGERECALLPRCASVRAPGGLVPTGGAGSRGIKSLRTPLEAPPEYTWPDRSSMRHSNDQEQKVLIIGGWLEMRDCGGVQVAHLYRVTISHRHRGRDGGK